MAKIKAVRLKDRAVISLTGTDARDFLQGLITNDIERVSPQRAVYAGLLTPQGKFLFDFFIVEWDGRILLDCEAARAADLAKRLTFYKLRADVTVTDESADLAVVAIIGSDAAGATGLDGNAGTAAETPGGVAFVDPRLSQMGVRLIIRAGDADKAIEALGAETADKAEYDSARLENGLPDASQDIPVEKAFLLEANFEELNGVDFAKGCYVGQEIVSRMKNRGTVKKRLLPVSVEGAMPEPGTTVQAADGSDAGTIRSGRDGRAIAYLRLEKAGDGTPLTAGESRVVVDKPDWARF